MSIDRQRIAAVRALERLGYTWNGASEWKPPLGQQVAVVAPHTPEQVMELKKFIKSLRGFYFGDPQSSSKPHQTADGKDAAWTPGSWFEAETSRLLEETKP